MRVDRFLSNLPQFNRKQVRLLLIEKRVQVDGHIVCDPHHEVRAFSRIECDGQCLQVGKPARPQPVALAPPMQARSDQCGAELARPWPKTSPSCASAVR